MSVKEIYTIKPIPQDQCREWLLYKHYAHRVPSIEYSFGLFEKLTLIGICTFGCPPRVMNNGESIFNTYRVKTLELNRLCVNEGLEPNTLSYFVSNCLRKLPTPCCVVSYADFTFGHNGYIYQATNWIYTGLNQIHETEWYDGDKPIHSRTLSGLGLTSADKKIAAGFIRGEYTQKHRYFFFIGNKKQKQQMMSDLIYPIQEYPKGDNKRYDSSYKPTTQGILF